MYKELVMQHYGGKCACCGVEDLVFLTIDHVEGDGGTQRKEFRKTNARGTGASFYKWIVENDYPDGLQVLCWNCNWAKSHGGCPHKGRVKEEKYTPAVIDTFVCHQCGVKFDNQGKMANHIRYTHSQFGETYAVK